MSTPAKVRKVTRPGVMWESQRDGYRVECSCGFVSYSYDHRETADLVREVHQCHERPKTNSRRKATPAHVTNTPRKAP